MSVICHHKSRISGDGTIHELIVVRVFFYQIEAVVWSYKNRIRIVDYHV